MTSTASISRLKQTTTTTNDRARRFGYSAGVPNMTMRQLASGLDCNPIEGGRLLLFVPQVERVQGMYNKFTGTYPRTVQEILPSTLSYSVARKFHETEDFGYRNLPMLTSLRYDFGVDADDKEYYVDEAHTYFDVVHPPINACPFGLERLTHHEHGQDSLQVCPTCRLESLKSDEISQRIFQASNTLDSNILASLRAVLIDANEAAIRYAERKIDLIDADLTKRSNHENGRTSRNETDYVYLKMAHRKIAADSTTNVVEQLTAALVSANAANMTARQTETPAISIDEFQAMQAEMKALRSQVLLQANAERLVKAESAVAEVAPEATPEVESEATEINKGDFVTIDGIPAKVIGKPFGKFTVEFPDGTNKTVKRDEIN